MRVQRNARVLRRLRVGHGDALLEVRMSQIRITATGVYPLERPPLELVEALGQEIERHMAAYGLENVEVVVDGIADKPQPVRRKR
jgi:hypothetical protein